jgi:hypothetical protein
MENAENGAQSTPEPLIAKKSRSVVLRIFVIFLGGYLFITFLYNGPDSKYSKKGFIKHVGFPPPPSVSKINYQSDDLWLDPTYRLRFVCSDPGVIEQFISFQQLQECKEPVRGLGGDDPKWWKEKDMKSNLKCFTREIPQNFWHLWYDPVTGTVWYEEYST